MSTNNFPFVEAVRYFWQRRQGQAAEQSARGMFDQGSRSAVTGGNHMNGFVMEINSTLVSAGVPQTDIHTRKAMTHLPGYFRSSKQWDLVVIRNDNVLAAIELKSQVGSFGNNFNNRAEEALGNAEDFWTAYREGFLGTSDPFVGFFFLIEDHPGSNSPVRTYEPHFSVSPEFPGTSYTTRLGILCQKMVLERKYSAACAITSSESQAMSRTNYKEIDGTVNSRSFLEQLVNRVSPWY